MNMCESKYIIPTFILSCDPIVGDEPNVKVATCMVAFSKHVFEGIMMFQKFMTRVIL